MCPEYKLPACTYTFLCCRLGQYFQDPLHADYSIIHKAHTGTFKSRAAKKVLWDETYKIYLALSET